MYVIAAPNARKPALACGPRKEGRNHSSASNLTVVPPSTPSQLSCPRRNMKRVLAHATIRRSS